MSGGDQEGVALKAPVSRMALPAGRSPFEASLICEVASEPGCVLDPGMSLAVARIAGQVVPGAEVARAWSAAFVRNVGWRDPILPPWKGRREGEFQAFESRGIEYRRGARRRTSP